MSGSATAATTAVGVLRLPGLARWLPLDLDADADAYRQRLLGTRSGSAEQADAVTRVATRLGAERSRPGVRLVAAWLLLDEPGGLAWSAHATLRGVGLPATRQTTDVVTRLLQGEAVVGSPEVDEVRTASGPALRVRSRPMGAAGGPDDSHDSHDTDGSRPVHARTSIAWRRPERDLLVVLGGYADDLAHGPALSTALTALARDASGL